MYLTWWNSVLSVVQCLRLTASQLLVQGHGNVDVPVTFLTLGSCKHVLPGYQRGAICLIVPKLQDLPLLDKVSRSLKVYREGMKDTKAGNYLQGYGNPCHAGPEQCVSGV